MEPLSSPYWLEKQIAFMFWPLGVRELIVNVHCINSFKLIVNVVGTHSAMGLSFTQASVVIAITDEWQFERITHLLGFKKCWDCATKDYFLHCLKKSR